MKQGQEVRHDAFYRVGHIYLIAIQLNLVALQVDVALDFREVEHTGQVERIVHVQVNPEQRFVGHRIQVAIELLVVFFLQFRRLLGPDRTSVVNQVVFFRFYLLAVFPFFLLAESYWYRKEVAILSQQALQTRIFQEFLAIVVYIQDDVGTPVVTLCFFEGELRTTVAAPFHGFGIVLIRTGDDFHFLGDHEGRVESQTEVTDDGVGIVLVFLQEVIGTGEGNLVDVFVDFFGCHTQTTVTDGDGTVVLVGFYADGQIAQFPFELTGSRQCFQFLSGIYGI